MKGYDNTVNVMRPATASTDRGQQRGQPTCVRREVPCSIETLTGNQSEIARQLYTDATYSVKFYADPSKPVDEKCYLTGGTLGERKLQIGHVADTDFKNLELTLLCGEKK